MSDEDDLIDLARGHFLRGQLATLEQRAASAHFSSWVDAVDGMINDGKEATVYLCRARPEVSGVELLAAKMYRVRKFRAFATESRYVNPRKMRDRRLAKAITQHSRKGQQATHQLWIEREWSALETLFAAGASVPKPYASCPYGILMEYLGDATARAPALAELRLPTDEAQRAFEHVLDDLEILLACGLVHGDLSAYNVLYHDGLPRLIDLPQSMHLDDASDPWSLFYRDVVNVCSYFEKRGVAVDATDLAMRLWRRR